MRPTSLKLGSKLTLDNEPAGGDDGQPQEDFYAHQSRLKMQARVALAQAKDLARMEMEVSWSGGGEDSSALGDCPVDCDSNSISICAPPPHLWIVPRFRLIADGTTTAAAIADNGADSE